MLGWGLCTVTENGIMQIITINFSLSGMPCKEHLSSIPRPMYWLSEPFPCISKYFVSPVPLALLISLYVTTFNLEVECVMFLLSFVVSQYLWAPWLAHFLPYLFPHPPLCFDKSHFRVGCAPHLGEGLIFWYKMPCQRFSKSSQGLLPSLCCFCGLWACIIQYFLRADSHIHLLS